MGTIKLETLARSPSGYPPIKKQRQFAPRPGRSAGRGGELKEFGMRKFLVAAVLFLSACANPGIVQISPDTYLLFREDHAGVFGSLSKLKAEVIEDANEFATSQGKVAIPISSREKPVGSGPAQWASFEYQFRVVDKDDPEVQRTSLLPRADVVVERTDVVDVDVTTEDTTQKPRDTYAELLKLDDLLKRGILTQAEFDAEKAKLLNGGSIVSVRSAATRLDGNADLHRQRFRQKLDSRSSTQPDRIRGQSM